MYIDQSTIIFALTIFIIAVILLCGWIVFLSRSTAHAKAHGVPAHEDHLWALFNTMTEGVVVIGEQGLIEFFNPVAERIFGYTAKEIKGRNVSLLMPEPHKSQHDSYIKNYLKTGESGILGVSAREVEAVRKGGESFPLEITVSEAVLDGRHLFIGLVRDITERKDAEERLKYLAQYDALTGLPSRTLFHDRVVHALAKASREEKLVAIMYLDLDYFKTVNDTLGHGKGDELLKSVGERISSSLRGCDTVARLGGDEFAIILENLPHIDHATIVAEKLIEMMDDPFQILGNEVEITLSIGITMYPFDHDNIDNLLRDADAAMYRAKQSGRNNYQYFSYDQTKHARMIQDISDQIARALAGKELVLHYQPRADLLSGRIIGVEALLRWDHPERGLLAPGEFLPVLEKGRLIYEVDEWVLRTACKQNRAWQKEGLEPTCITVNIAANSLRRKGLADIVDKILKETGLDADYLELDVPGLKLSGPDRDLFKKRLEELKNLGVHIALADYGTASPFIESLQNLPLDTLKIDRAFVHNASVDPDHAAISLAIVRLARALRLKVVAEGVETAQELALLRDYGCDSVQGYLFSKPVTAQEFASQLKQGKRLQ